VSYLLGGADYVLANLWDVTDKDIDKLSIECMRKFFDDINIVKKLDSSSCSDWGTMSETDTDNFQIKSKKTDLCDDNNFYEACYSLSRALITSRSVCKMQNVVGCAPVIYGLPL
jgi:separase